jgi:hypothetical protein
VLCYHGTDIKNFPSIYQKGLLVPGSDSGMLMNDSFLIEPFIYLVCCCISYVFIVTISFIYLVFCFFISSYSCLFAFHFNLSLYVSIFFLLFV